MYIFVKVSAARTITLHVQASDTVATVKSKIQTRESISPEQQLLMFSGVELEDSRALSYYRIQNMATLHVAMRRGTRATTDAEGQLLHQLADVQQQLVAAHEGWRLTEAARTEWYLAAVRLGWGQPSGVGTVAPSSSSFAVQEGPSAALPSSSSVVKEDADVLDMKKAADVSAVKEDEHDGNAADAELSTRQKKRRRQQAAKVHC